MEVLNIERWIRTLPRTDAPGSRPVPATESRLTQWQMAPLTLGSCGRQAAMRTVQAAFGNQHLRWD